MMMLFIDKLYLCQFSLFNVTIRHKDSIVNGDKNNYDLDCAL